MVFIALIALISLPLLALLVVGLHRYQLSIVQTNADNYSPLPPLDNIELNRDLPDLSLEGAALNIGESSDFDSPSEQQIESPVRDDTDPNSEPGLPKKSAGDVAVVSESEPGSEHDETRNEGAEEYCDTAINVPDQSHNPISDSIDEPGAEHRDLLDCDTGSYALSALGTDVPITSDSALITHAEPVDHTDKPSASGIVVDQQPAPACYEDAIAVAEDISVVRDVDPVRAPEFSETDEFVDHNAANKDDSTSDQTLDPSAIPESWQDQVAELKKRHRYDEALQICRQEFPLWSAYQQASLVHRARIKQLGQADQDINGELSALYRLAAQASFLHDRVKGLPNLSLAQLKQLDLSAVAELEMPYQHIGYTELRLIKKTDIKLLLDKWGKPDAHIRPRELHPDAWKELCGETQSTLF